MAERFERLFTLKEDLYLAGSPVIIKAGALLLDKVSTKVLAQVKLRSIAPCPIKEAKITLTPMNAAGQRIGEDVVHSFIELNAQRNSDFGAKAPIYMPDNNTRAFNVFVSEVTFSDGVTWKNDKGNWQQLPKQLPLGWTSADAIREYKRRFGQNATAKTDCVLGVWRCTCGAINSLDEQACHLCRASLEEQRTANEPEYENEAKYLIACALQQKGDNESLEKARGVFVSLGDWRDSADRVKACDDSTAQNEATAKKNKKTALIASGIAACALIVILLFTNLIIPTIDYNKAADLVDEGKYAEASNILYYGSPSKHKQSEADALLAEIYDAVDLIAKEQIERGDYNGAYDTLTSICGISAYNSEYYSLAKSLYEGDYKAAINEGMTTIVIPEGTTEIKYSAFEGCTSLVSVVIPDSVTKINEKAFKGCTGLTSITLPSGLKNIGANAFEGCSSFVTLVIPNSVTEIAHNAFKGCSKLTKITLSSGLETIKASSFEGFTSLTDIVIPNGITQIGDKAFKGCTGLTSITLPSSLKTIGANAFEGCKNITSLTIPSSVTDIGKNAFKDMNKINMLTVPDNVTKIGEGAFSGWSSLESLTIPFVGDGSGKTSYGNALFGYLFGSSSYEGGVKIKQYYSTSSYDYDNNYIPQSLKTVTVTGGTLAYGAFQNCTMLETVNLPNTTVSISGEAFSGCTGITAITIPDNVTSIDYQAFLGCTGLTTITLPSTLETIGSSAFEGCTELTSLTLPNGLKTIGSYAFEGLSKIKTVTVPNSVTSIGYDVFSGCSSLESMTIPFVGDGSGSTRYGYALFGYLFGSSSYEGGVRITQYYSTSSYDYDNNYIPQNLKTVTVTGGTLAYGAFQNCTMLETVNLPNTTVSILGKAFSGCSGITAITIPDSVTSIDNTAFSGCSSLSKVKLGSGINTIPSSILALSNLSELTISENNPNYKIENKLLLSKNGSTLYKLLDKTVTSFTVPSTVTAIGDYAFSSCTALNTVTVPKTVTSVATYAFTDSKIKIASAPTSVLPYLPKSQIIVLKITSGTTIDSTTLSSYTALLSVTVPNTVTAVSSSAFKSCSSLIEIINHTTLTLSSSTAEIHSGATKLKAQNNYYFYTKDGTNYLVGYFGSETDITLPTSYNGGKYAIYKDAFYNNDSLTSITIGSGVAEIDTYAFFDCDSLTTVQMGNNVTSIGASAFRECSALSSVTIGSKVETIGSYAFYNCDKLTEVVIPDSVKTINYRAFYECYGLKKVTIGIGVTYMDDAFYYCYNLSEAIFKDTTNWKAGYSYILDPTDLTNTSTAAKWLGSTYDDYEWTKS